MYRGQKFESSFLQLALMILDNQKLLQDFLEDGK